MAELRLKKSATLNQIKDLLNTNLSGGIVPVEKYIPEIKSKGIYFWYLESKNGYDNLSKFEDIKPIENSLSRIIDGVKYDLVYIGTAGVLKKEKSNLTVRLKWHITQMHRESAFSGKNPALSTLRLAIGSLLSNDLIIENTEKKVNDFIKNNMRIFWIEYPEIKKLIDSDETILIDVVKPLINIKHNANAKKNAINNPTKRYRARRIEVIAATMSRLKGEGKSSSKITKTKNNGGKVPPKKPTEILNGEGQRSPKVNNKCVSFNVKQNESAADVAAKTNGLPKGKVSIDIFDLETNERLYSSHRADGSRNTKLAVADFFKNLDTYVQPNRSKQVVLQEEMISRKVKEVRVIICPIFDNDKTPKKKSIIKNSTIINDFKSVKTVKTLSKKINKSINKVIKNKSEEAKVKINNVIKSINFTKIKTNNKLLIISCSDSKVSGGEATDLQNYFLHNNLSGFFNNLIDERAHRMAEYKNLFITNPDYFNKKKPYGTLIYNQCILTGECLPAYLRYAGKNAKFYTQELINLYLDKNLNSNLHILIVSGLYGIIEFRDSILNYHLRIDKPDSIWRNENNFTLRNVVQQYIHDNKIENKNVFHAVSKTTYGVALDPLPEWNDLWISVPNSGNGNNIFSANCVKAFLENL